MLKENSECYFTLKLQSISGEKNIYLNFLLKQCRGKRLGQIFQIQTITLKRRYHI